jgi:putative phage-type endonuclease
VTALSPERVGRITGSRVAAILGLSPYATAESVLRAMVRERLGAPPEFSGNIATEWGKDNEPAATADYERYRGVMVHADQHFVVHPSIDYLGCTPDGLVGETGMVQIKCPYRATYTTLDERPDYAAQIQFELAVLDREWSDFVVWRPSGLAVTRTGRDPGWLDANLAALDLFIADYEDAVHDTDRHRAFLDDAETVPVRDDFEWQMAALEWLEASSTYNRAKTAREAARQRLIDLAAGQEARGAGVSVTHRDTEPSSYTVSRKGGLITTVRAAS